MTIKFFADLGNETVELTRVYQERNGQWFGEPVNSTPVWNREANRWDRAIVAATRKIEMKRSPSRHECDSRCLNAVGKIMRCECTCGGKNHGRGNVFICEAA